MEKQYNLKKNFNELLTNPFFIYGSIWLFTIAMYILNFSNLLPKLNVSILTFFLIICTICYYMVFYTKKKEVINIRFSINYNIVSTIVLIIVFIYFIISIIVNKGIPFISIINGTSRYTEQFYIPGISFLVNSLALFCGAILSIMYLQKQNRTLLIKALCIFIYFILTVQRGMIVYLISIFIFSYIYIFGLNKKKLLILLLSLLVLLYLFSIYGNIRSGLEPFNFDYFHDIWGLSNSILPKWLSFPYMYIVSPLANLQATINVGNNVNSLSLFILSSVIPDFISNDIVFLLPKMTLIDPSLNVGSTFIEPFLSFGYFGMLLNACSYFLLFFFVTKFKTNCSITNIFFVSSICTLATFSFFDNYITFSGFNIILIYPIFFSFLLYSFKKVYIYWKV